MDDTPYSFEQTPLASRACAADSSFLAEATGTPRLPPAEDDEPSIEEALWRIFTRYADARRPDRLPSRQFLAFCRDCQLLRGKADRAAAEVLVRTRLNGRQNHLTFVDFAEILAAFSQSIKKGRGRLPRYTTGARGRLAKRRTVGPVDMTGDVAKILQRMRRPLDGVFARLGKDLPAFLAFCGRSASTRRHGPVRGVAIIHPRRGRVLSGCDAAGLSTDDAGRVRRGLVRLADAAYPSNICWPDKLRALLVQLAERRRAAAGLAAQGRRPPRAPSWTCAHDYRDYLAVGSRLLLAFPALERLSPARGESGGKVTLNNHTRARAISMWSSCQEIGFPDSARPSRTRCRFLQSWPVLDIVI